jgi:hypothetical protein
VQAAFGRWAVVAGDVDNERVVEFSGIFDGLNDTTDLVVGVLDGSSKDLHPACTDLLVQVRKRVPRRQARGPRRHSRAGRDDSQLELSRKNPFPELVVAVVELAAILLDEFLWRSNRRFMPVRRAA